jgi:putative oxidoreductase
MTDRDGAALVLRLAVGTTFLFSGLQKVLLGPASTVDLFRDLGVPWPELLGPLSAGLELVGGLALLAGALTRIAAGLLAVEMLAALAFVRVPQASTALSTADAVTTVRLELLLLASCASIVLLGPGRASVDSMTRQLRSACRSADRD